jgi:acetylornithine deacetylase
VSSLGVLRSTLADLVGIDSTSARSNAAIIDYLDARLSSMGFTSQRLAYVDDAGVEKVNLVGVAGGPRSARAELALVAHTDCVPFDPDWKEALTLTEKNDCFYGRGACDTKAFISAALAAANAARASTLEAPLMLIFTADEEVGCVGAKHLVERKFPGAHFAIVGEPTSLTAIRGNKGYCLAEVEVLGKEGHSAYPETGRSAIFRAGRFLSQLEKAALGELRQEVDPSFQPPFSTLNVGLISGGKARNIIPGSCRFSVEWRPIPGQNPDRGLQLLERLKRQLEEEEPGFQAQIRVLRSDAGWQISPDSEVVRFIAQQTGTSPATVAFGTEARQLSQMGSQAVVFGPGDIRQAHQSGEFVPIPELVRCEEVLERAINYFCRRTGSGA